LLDDLVERAQALASRQVRRLRFIRHEKEGPSEQDIRAERIVNLAETADCQEGLLPLLLERLEAVENMESSTLGSHADLCHLLGRKAELKETIALLRNPSGQA